MKRKLEAFEEFAQSLYPHEVHYLVRENQLADPQKLEILKLVEYNSRFPERRVEYDPGIDKRKYSHLKQWMAERLQALDVDRQFLWLHELEARLLTDTLEPSQEKALLRRLREADPREYYFNRLYELAQTLGDHLLIRGRDQNHRAVGEFLQAHHASYLRSSQTNRLLHLASRDIIRQQDEPAAALHWEPFLREKFRDESLDAFTRYRAVIRLIYALHNQRRFDQLEKLTDELGKALKDPRFYSKRVLANFYANRCIMYTQRGKLDLAVSNGMLSIRQKNADHLFYLNHLCRALLRQGKAPQALGLLQAAQGHQRDTNSFHDRLAYTTLLLRALEAVGKARQAESHAESFRDAYRKEIFESRWQAFYKAYLGALFRQGKHDKALREIRRAELVAHERALAGRPGHLPLVEALAGGAALADGELEPAQARAKVASLLPGLAPEAREALASALEPHFPELARTARGGEGQA